MNEIPKSTQKYYAEKAGKITQIFAEKIGKNYEDYEGFINIPFTKSMIRLKFDVDLHYKTNKGNKTKSMSDEDIFEMVVDESLLRLICSGIEKQIPNKELDIFLTNQIIKSSAFNVIEFLDSALKNSRQEEVDKIRFMYVGEKCCQIIPEIVGSKNFDNFFLGEYKGIKIFYIEQLEDIYITSAPFIDLTSIDVRYNEYIKEEFDMYNNNKRYERVKNELKNAIITLNCNLGDIKIIKLKTIYGNGNAFMRKLKLQRILKNEIDI